LRRSSKLRPKRTPDKGPGSEELEIALEKQKKNLDDAERSMQELALVETGIGGNSDLELLEAMVSLRNAALLARTRLSLVSEQNALLITMLKSAAGQHVRTVTVNMRC
jgi:hypothetical protein